MPAPERMVWGEKIAASSRRWRDSSQRRDRGRPGLRRLLRFAGNEGIEVFPRGMEGGEETGRVFLVFSCIEGFRVRVKGVV